MDRYLRMIHQFPFDVQAAESYIRANHPEVNFDSVTPTLEDGAAYLAKSGDQTVFRLPLLEYWRSQNDQTPNRWAAFTDSELSSLYNVLFASEEVSEDLDAIQAQMKDEIGRRCEREMSDEAASRIIEKVAGNRKSKVAGN